MDAADRSSLTAWADKIDSRVGPISGRDADAIAVLFRKLAAEAASPAAGWTMVPTHALDWLHGRGPDENGIWFGDEDLPLPPRKFWWRTVFNRLCGIPPKPAPSGEARAG